MPIPTARTLSELFAGKLSWPLMNRKRQENRRIKAETFIFINRFGFKAELNKIPEEIK
jgi:hypothetical protein